MKPIKVRRKKKSEHDIGNNRFSTMSPNGGSRVQRNENPFDNSNQQISTANTRQTTGLSQNSYLRNNSKIPSFIHDFNDNFLMQDGQNQQEISNSAINRQLQIQIKPRTSNMMHQQQNTRSGLPHEQFIDSSFLDDYKLPEIKQHTPMMNLDDQIQRRNYYH